MVYADNNLVSNSGSPFKTIYSPKVDEEGRIELVEAGVENFQEYIDSFRDSCDIQLIIKRVEQGDLTVLNKAVGFYGDVTKLPKTYAELLQLQIDSKKAFDSLPIEVKHKFDDDANVFFATSGTEEWMKKLGIVNEVKEVVSEEKVDNE